MPATTSRHLEPVPDGPDGEEQDAVAEAAILEAFTRVRERERIEVAAVQIPRYQGLPQFDEDGNARKGTDGSIVRGPLVLYFRKLNPATVQNLRSQHTTRVQVRQRGQLLWDERFDANTFGIAVIYAAMLPWCRRRYFDDQRLWGNEPVGTATEFMEQRLTQNELTVCLEAISALEGTDDEQATLLGKGSAPEGRSS
jgi:hypothetical protein